MYKHTELLGGISSGIDAITVFSNVRLVKGMHRAMRAKRGLKWGDETSWCQASLGP